MPEILVFMEREAFVKTEKPPYRVPSMAEIAAVPWNGLTAVSTFCGCGGSCLGYRMAGFRVVWANEFIPAAAEVYRANHPETTLDTRDIRNVQPAEIFAATGLKVGELDLLDGSPPCSSFFTAGKREKHWGMAKRYSDTVQRRMTCSSSSSASWKGCGQGPSSPRTSAVW